MGKFCKNCGAHINQHSKFCASCGTAIQTKLQSAHADNPNYMPHSPTAQHLPTATKKCKNKKSLVVILASVLLIILGIQNMSLSIVGKTANAKITSATPDTRTHGSSLPDPNRYIVNYEFYVNGERYSGQTNQTFKHPIISTQTIAVRYLPYYPSINAASNDAKISGGLILLGLGSLLLILGFQKEISFGRRKKLCINL